MDGLEDEETEELLLELFEIIVSRVCAGVPLAERDGRGDNDIRGDLLIDAIEDALFVKRGLKVPPPTLSFVYVDSDVCDGSCEKVP